MGTSYEAQRDQKDKLYLLMKLSVLNAEESKKALDDEISRTKAIMPQEDVAHIEKEITNRYVK